MDNAETQPPASEWVRNHPKYNDPRSTEELIRLALTEEDEDAAWEPVMVLHFRGNREVLEAALRLCQSEAPEERALGANILSQLDVDKPQHAFLEEAVAVLLDLLEREQDPSVLNAIGMALGHRMDERAIQPLLRFKDHLDEDVRFGVTYGLMGHEDEAAIEGLIELSHDEVTEIRSWATFALAVQIDSDSPAIRETLYQRLSDEDAETRGEALVGLAKRRDPRVLQPLMEDLQAERVGTLSVEAARELKDPHLYPLLVKLKEWWDVDETLLNEAIENCSGNVQQQPKV